MIPDIISPTDKIVLSELIARQKFESLTLMETIRIAKSAVHDWAKEASEELIRDGQANKILSQFRAEQPEAYHHMSAEIRGIMKPEVAKDGEPDTGDIIPFKE
jgi:hypothetical protein